MPRGRPKGAKNKKTVEVTSFTEESNGSGTKYWGNKIFLVIETPKKGTPRLHSYTEVEAGARSMVKLLQDVRPTSKFEIMTKDVDWSKPVSII